MSEQLKFEVPYDERPIFDITIAESGRSIRCLLDTGANIPIWFADVELLLNTFPDATKTSYVTHISGLGKSAHTNVPIWKIPKVTFVDETGNTLVFKKVLLPVLGIKKFRFNLS